ncbi:hypothetical protein GCM10023259_000130 [Thermocatellispora tengchongensis]
MDPDATETPETPETPDATETPKTSGTAVAATRNADRLPVEAATGARRDAGSGPRRPTWHWCPWTPQWTRPRPPPSIPPAWWTALDCSAGSRRARTSGT